MSLSARSSIVKLVFLVLLCTAGHAGGNPTRSMLIVGDSLSAGFGIETEESWVSLLQNRLESEGYGYHVVNASISGDTTTGGLRRLPRALDQYSPDIVIIELGGNDGLRGTPVSLIQSNLAAMIRQSLAAGARVVLTGMQIPSNYGTAYTEAFAGIYSELADQYEIILVSRFLQEVALDPSLMQPDGIHPNAAGQPVLLEKVWGVLEPELDATLAAS